MADTNELIGAGMPALQATLLGETAPVRSTYNNAHGLMPASQATAGFEITNNYSEFGEVDFWNLVNRDANEQGWYFRQKLTNTTEYTILALASNPTVSYMALQSPTAALGGVSLNARDTAGQVGTSGALPLELQTNGTARVTIGAAGGLVLAAGAFGIPTSTPSAANAAGVTGTIAWDANFIYVCINTNTWKRVAIATWP